MSKVFFYSIFTKSIGAILEVVLQIIIIRFLHMDGYGEYSYYVGLADMGFWIFFSAISKCNIFYCSQKENSILGFRKKYYSRYVIPVLLVCFSIAIFRKDIILSLVVAIFGMETLVLDESSQLLANGRYSLSLIGEYCFGRVFLVIFTMILGIMKMLTLKCLLILYLLQYIFVYAVFLLRDKGIFAVRETKVSLRKIAAYQYGDILYGVIQKAPVILEYIFTGAFTAGFVNLVALVRMVAAFVSGPTSKVFMPTFANLYQNKEKEKLADLYQRVMILQMIFLTAISVALVGFPKLILQLFSGELVEYASIFSGISVCFLIALSFGPCSSLMQMTGNEKKDIAIRSISVVFMIIVWFVTRKTELFVLFGIGTQVLSEYIMDYYVIARIIGRIPIGVMRYLFLWCPAIIVIVFVRIFQLPQNIFAMFVAAFLAVLLYCALQMTDVKVRIWLKEEIGYGIIKK